MIEVHAGKQPVVPHRALIVASLLAALTCGLAAGMVCRRSGAVLGMRHAPEGWGISFQPPRSFESAGEYETDGDTAILFRGVTYAGAELILVVQRIEVEPGVDPDDVARHIAGEYKRRQPFDPQWPGPARAITELGPHQAIEIVDQQSGFVVRATLLQSGHALAVSLSTQRPTIDSRLYRMFDRTCRSVEYD